MKFKDLANGMVFQFAFDQRSRTDWWYTKIEDTKIVCVKSGRDEDSDFGKIDDIEDRLEESEIVLATKFSS